MKRKDELSKLREDEHYYGKFGKQFLSNSDISTLLTNPLALGKPMKPIPAFLVVVSIILKFLSLCGSRIAV